MPDAPDESLPAPEPAAPSRTAIARAAWFALSPEEKAQRIAEKRSKPLQGWETSFTHWLAGQWEEPSEEKQLRMLRQLHPKWAGGQVGPKTLQRLKRRTSFQEYFTKERQRLTEVYQRRAHQQVNEFLPEAVGVAKIAVRKLKKELETGDDPLGAIRAAANLLPPFLDRAAPKKNEGSVVATNISITLSSVQMARLDAPESVVSGEEIIVEPELVE
jgi:hypothetical protein